MEEDRKSIMGPIEKVILLIAIIVLGYIIVKNGGCGIVKRTEKVEFIDPPTNGKGQSVPRPRKKQSQQSVDEALKAISESLGQGQEPWPTKETSALSTDENEYLRSVSEKHQIENKIQSTKEWLSMLKTSYDTYQQVKTLFDQVVPENREGGKTNSYDSIFRDEQLANTIYQELEDYFKLPSAQAKDFAQKGKVSIRDWAEFIASNPNRVSDGK